MALEIPFWYCCYENGASSYHIVCDYSGAVAQSKDPRNHKKGKHIKRKYHIIQDIVPRGDVVLAKIDSANNLVDPFTKALPKDFWVTFGGNGS